MSGPTGQSTPLAPPALRVSVEIGPGDIRRHEFRAPFRIGRGDDCPLSVKNEYVSRNHAEVVYEKGQWLIRDLGSANGLFVDGQRVPGAAIAPSAVVRLGVAGPILTFHAQPGVENYIDHYFSSTDRPAGEHTIMVRQAFKQVQKKQKRKYGGVIAALALLVLGVAGYSFYLRRQVSERKAMAQNLFYSMKALDVDMTNVRKLVTDANSQQGLQEIAKYQRRRQDMERDYDRFLAALKLSGKTMSPEDRLLFRVTRIFGECELDMPQEFAAEVNNYIGKWKSSARLANALRTARDNRYTKPIAQELLAAGLPPQFFYLALQESNFDAYVSGPTTHKGIAKGMWQFIPETGVKYGLKIGPLADLRRPDPGDDRHHWDLETKAAVRYMRDLYSSDAQASGLLVMACYNWGENSVLPLVRKLPANPRERNFWRLLSTYRQKIPQETYDYVFYIVSAAVIGENPRLFGFDFDNPLAEIAAE
jgi:membrane-bound lytic murein transglycosylase D